MESVLSVGVVHIGGTVHGLDVFVSSEFSLAVLGEEDTLEMYLVREVEVMGIG
jgi:hypothetical protein